MKHLALALMLIPIAATLFYVFAANVYAGLGLVGLLSFILGMIIWIEEQLK